ncbi:preprotein translocase subunit SecY [Sebaldella termitidis]|uniref:Protein translocase subunit SecY n=1 Tax=Sebaldella termitidis (strain ATCC 33386 / NCTC 11300) TaxID=526218 RepID=D1AGT7_SEBTE|nr:preprotein translocase subunit SecY [Sebaldella termitidis]ACZ10807.1 preprotein translocase, SecY subunit [Sebaldella termitidis ATCC 33386]SUI26150.1 preprotein translocase subunit SecY [Sebaldella termitidis]
MTLVEEVVHKVKSIIEIPELRKRVVFTLIMFLVARVGVHIQVPGIDVSRLSSAMQGNSLAGFINTFSGGGFQNASMFALGIIPYINSSIIFQLLGVVVPKLEEMQKEGGKEKEKVTQWTRYLTIGVAIAQSFGLTILLQQQQLVYEPGPMFTLVTVTLMTGGTAFLMWVAERISLKGIGNGTSMLIFLSIVSRLPAEMYQIGKNLSTSGGMGLVLMLITIVLFVILIAVIVLIQLAERRIPIQYVGKGRTGRSSVGQKTFLPLKINMSGVMPIIFASVLMAVPSVLISLVKDPSLNAKLKNLFSQTGVGYLVLYAVLVVLFAFFYTSIVFDPEKVADNLKQGGATVPGKRPGSETVDYLEGVATRITFGSAVFLAVLGVLPNIFFGYFLKMPVLMSGTSLLILVGVAVDLLQQIDSHLAVKSYKGFISK